MRRWRRPSSSRRALSGRRSRSWPRSTRAMAWAELVAARAAWEASAGTVQQAQRAYQIAERALHQRRVHAARAVGCASARSAGRGQSHAGRARSAGGARAVALLPICRSARARCGHRSSRATGAACSGDARAPHAAGRQQIQERVVSQTQRQAGFNDDHGNVSCGIAKLNTVRMTA